MISLQTLNQSDQQEFVKNLGGIFEHSPWVAEQVYALRPFESVNSLHQDMVKIVNQADRELRKTLICNHPELAGSEAESGTLTSESQNEQATAGLNFCSADELKRLREMNRLYLEKFGFPFVIAVKQLTRYDILEAIEKRLKNSAETEFQTCIQQIGKIAYFRLRDLIKQ